MALGQYFCDAFLESLMPLCRCVLRRFLFGNRQLQAPMQLQLRAPLQIPVPMQHRALLPVPVPNLSSQVPAVPRPLPFPPLVPVPIPNPLPQVPAVPRPLPLPLPAPILLAPQLPAVPLALPLPVPAVPATDGDSDDDNAANTTHRRRRRSELELLTNGIQTPDLDRSLRSRHGPQRLQVDHSTPRRAGHVQRQHQ